MMDSKGTTSYSYDNNSRLAAVTYPGQSQITFGYDWVGNLDSKKYGVHPRN